ncbi:MAG: methylmalonyl-CoA mutase family protein, partial [Candidatus Binataceae bacterium]
EQQPEVNIIRIAYEALPVTISAAARVGALQLPGFREALALPDQAEQTLSLRTQQVLMHETGITKYGDIFAGSKVIEGLTAETAERARTIAMEMRAAGYSRSIGIVAGELTRALAERQRKLETGEIVQVGVNSFLGEIGLIGPAGDDTQDSEDGAQASIEKDRVDSITRWRAERDHAAVARARQALEQAASAKAATMDATLALARAGGTVGEWTDSIVRASHGRYTPPILEARGAVASLGIARAPRKMKVALGKAGLDGHINAVKLLAHACMQAGMEVVLAGFKQTAEQMVETALQEDVDVLAISSLAGAHMTIAREALAMLHRRGAGDVRVVIGGIIPEPDRPRLLAMGVRAVFTPKDSNLAKIVARIAELGPRAQI